MPWTTGATTVFLGVTLLGYGASPASAQAVEDQISRLEAALDWPSGPNWGRANIAIQRLNALRTEARSSVGLVARTFQAAVEWRMSKTEDRSDARYVLAPSSEILMRFGADARVSPGLLRLLRKEVEDRYVIPETLRALEACASSCTEAIPMLVDLIENDRRGRFGAFSVLGAMGPAAREAIPLLVTELEEDPSPTLRGTILAALSNIDPGYRDANVGQLEALLENMSEDDARYVPTLVQIGGEVAIRAASAVVEKKPTISSILAFVELEGAPEASLALPGLVSALGSNVKANYAGLRAEVGAAAYSLSVSAAAAWTIRRNGLGAEAVRLLRQDAALMAAAYRGMISLGVGESVPDLLSLLDRLGDAEMATVYLNSGHPGLASAARTWAQRNGYSIGAVPRSATAPAWGGGN